jgi:hypothetical protein
MNRRGFILLLGVVGFILLVWKRHFVSSRGMSVIASVTGIGIVDETPEELASAQGVSVEVESLARVGQSEETGDGSIACMWATKNQANRRGMSITALVTLDHDDDGNDNKYAGHYSRYHHGRYCSTFKEPSGEMLTAAAAVISGSIPDPTGGAIHWDAPHGLLSDHNVADRRMKDGLKEFWVDGVTKTRFWRP